MVIALMLEKMKFLKFKEKTKGRFFNCKHLLKELLFNLIGHDEKCFVLLYESIQSINGN